MPSPLTTAPVSAAFATACAVNVVDKPCFRAILLQVTAITPEKLRSSSEKVSNGFIVTARSSKNMSERLSIAKNLKDANKMASKFLGK